MATIFGQIDTGELAARLGSPVTFDRRGNVIFIEEFTDGLARWVTAGSGTGHTQSTTIERWNKRGISCKMTTGDAATNYKQLRHFTPFPVVGKIGFEVSFTIDENAEYMSFYNVAFDGTYGHYGQFRFYPPAMELKYKDSTGDYVSLAAGLNLSTNDKMFHTFKFVHDIKTDRYVRAIFDSYTYDMSALTSFKDEETTSIGLQTYLYIRTGSAVSSVMYVDDVILTQNEP